MTIVAYKDGIMAADSQITSGWHRCSTHARKIHRIGSSYFGFTAARMGEIPEFMRWLKAGKPEDKRPHMGEGFEVMEVDTKGRIFLWDSRCERMRWREPFYATGGGLHFALGAMEAGASAVEAVRITKKLFLGAGGQIQQVKILKPVKESLKR